MIKHLQFQGRTESGIFAQSLFGSMEKTAGASPFADTGDALKKAVSGISKADREKYCYVLVNALGAGEFFGSNINADYFPWNALAHEGDDYGYKTFLAAHAFSHHKNKDPERAFGVPIVSVLNPRMKRVELVIKLDREKAKLEQADGIISRIDAGEFPDVSMGCKVPFDVCSICGNHSKTKDDYCKHMRPGPEDREKYGPNKILKDGRKIYVINTLPRFFDISFVFIGADKTAKVMMKLASSGLWVPSYSGVLSADVGFQFYTSLQEPMQKVAFVEKDVLHGGPADQKPKKSFDPKALRNGAKHEMEHTDRKDIAEEIASDHLTEDSKYYEKLKGVEKKASHRKLSEILKNVPGGSFAMKKLQGLEKKEPTIPAAKLKKMSAHPLSAVLGAVSSMGFVLKPEEFQHLVLTKMGEAEAADDFLRHNQVFQKVASVSHSLIEFDEDARKTVVPLLSDLVKDRTAFGSSFLLRTASFEKEAKNALPTPSTVKHSLLDKISAAYNGYRRELMMKMSQATEMVQSDPKLREVVLGDGLVNMFAKTASAAPIVTHDSVAYMTGAHFSDRGLLSTTAVAEAIAANNHGLLTDEDPSA